MTDPATATVQSFPVEGMTCASCVRRVEKAISAVPGVRAAAVNLATERADVTLGAPATPQAVIAAIRSAGYEVAGSSFELGVEGMTCASCVKRVEKAIAGVPGVLSASVNLATERATVKAVGMELCPELDITIPVGMDSMSMRTVGQEASGKRSMAAPVMA